MEQKNREAPFDQPSADRTQTLLANDTSYIPDLVAVQIGELELGEQAQLLTYPSAQDHNESISNNLGQGYDLSILPHAVGDAVDSVNDALQYHLHVFL